MARGNPVILARGPTCRGRTLPVAASTALLARLRSSLVLLHLLHFVQVPILASVSKKGNFSFACRALLSCSFPFLQARRTSRAHNRG